MKAFAEVVKKCLGNAQQSIVYCSNYQFRRCYQLFAAVKEKHNEADAVNDDIANVIVMLLLTIERK